MKIVAIIQARISSTRLPEKIIMDLAGKPIIVNIVERVKRAKMVDKVVVATSVDSSDDKVEVLLNEKRIECFRGDLDNVLERFFLCAQKYNADIVIRLTGDNALVSPEIIDEAIELFKKKDVDYLRYKDILPLGMRIEVFSFEALKKAYHEATNKECLEHVTPYIYKNPNLFRSEYYIDDSNADHSDLRFTIDTPLDYEFVSKIYNSFRDNTFSYADVLQLLEEHTDWLDINKDVAQKTVAYSGE